MNEHSRRLLCRRSSTTFSITSMEYGLESLPYKFWVVRILNSATPMVPLSRRSARWDRSRSTPTRTRRRLCTVSGGKAARIWSEPFVSPYVSISNSSADMVHVLATCWQRTTRVPERQRRRGESGAKGNGSKRVGCRKDETATGRECKESGDNERLEQMRGVWRANECCRREV